MILDHIDLRVRDRAAAARFYDAFLALLGAIRSDGLEFTTWVVPVLEKPGEPSNFGIAENPNAVAGSIRVAFRAPSRETVDEVARILARIGAQNIETDDGVYGADYYGVFFADPEGNMLEVCVKG